MFAGALYVVLNVVSFVTIFGFNYYEGKFGGRWDNLLLNAILHVPLTLVIGLGYSTIVLAIRKQADRGNLSRPIWAAIIAGVLTFAPALAPDLLPDASVAPRLTVVTIYWFCLGSLVAIANWWPVQRSVNAA